MRENKNEKPNQPRQTIASHTHQIEKNKNNIIANSNKNRIEDKKDAKSTKNRKSISRIQNGSSSQTVFRDEYASALLQRKRTTKHYLINKTSTRKRKPSESNDGRRNIHSTDEVYILRFGINSYGSQLVLGLCGIAMRKFQLDDNVKPNRNREIAYVAISIIRHEMQSNWPNKMESHEYDAVPTTNTSMFSLNWQQKPPIGIDRSRIGSQSGRKCYMYIYSRSRVCSSVCFERKLSVRCCASVAGALPTTRNRYGKHRVRNKSVLSPTKHTQTINKHAIFVLISPTHTHPHIHECIFMISVGDFIGPVLFLLSFLTDCVDVVDTFCFLHLVLRASIRLVLTFPISYSLG